MAASAIGAIASAALATFASPSLSILGGLFTFSGFSAFLVRAAVGIALNALVPKPKTQGANRGYQVTTRGSALDHQVIYGTMRTGGVIVYDKTTGNKNKFLHRVIAFAGHEIDAFEEFYIDGEAVTLSGYDYEVEYTYSREQGGGTVEFTETMTLQNVSEADAIHLVGDSLTSGEWAALSDSAAVVEPELWINNFISATVTSRNVSESGVVSGKKYAKKVKIYPHLGSDDQVADYNLIAATEDEEDGVWTEDHRLRGIAYIYIRMQFDEKVFPNGVPEITAKIRGKKVYDPRDVGQSPTDSSTWEYSDNPALCVRDYIASDYGLGEVSANIDDDLVIAAANVCEATLNDGSQLYTCNGAFVTEITPIDLLGDLLTSMGGLLWYAQGKWRMKPAHYVAPTLTLTEDDLRSNIAVRTRHSRRDNYNTIKGTFRGEESNWQVTDYPEVTSSVFVEADGGQESVLDLELPFTDNSEEARRIALIALERNRQQLTVSASFGLRALTAQVGDIIKLSIDRFGWDEKEFEVGEWTFGLTEDNDLQVTMTLREISESVFDQVPDAATYENDNTSLPDPFNVLPPSNVVVSGGGFTAADGTYVNSFIVSWDASLDAFVSQYEIQWRRLGESLFQSSTLQGTQYQISPVEDDVEYEIRVRAVSGLGVPSPWVNVNATVGGDTTAPSAPTSVTAVGGFKYINVSWTNPPDADLSFVEVYENDTDTSVGATLVGSIWGNSFVRTNLGLDETKYYFLKAVDYSGNKSVFSASASGTTTYLDDDDYENGIRTLFEDQGLYAIEDVATLPASGILNRKVFNRSDGKLYEWDGSDWVTVIGAAAANELIGQITSTQITDGAISTPKLAAGAVTATNIAGSTITGDKIAANTITGGLIAASGVITNTAQINDALITNAKIADAAITNAKISGSISSTDYVADTSGWIIDKDGSAEFDTIHIRSNAITRYGVSGSGEVLNESASWTTVTSFDLDLSNECVVQGLIYFQLTNNASQYPATALWQVRGGGTVLLELERDELRDQAGEIIRPFSDTSAGPDSTYTVEFRIYEQSLGGGLDPVGGRGVEESDLRAVGYLK